PSASTSDILPLSLHDALPILEFVGLRNYPRVAKDPLFQQAFINTLLILVVVGVTIFVLAFSMSLVLRNMWGKGIVRSVIFFPHLDRKSTRLNSSHVSRSYAVS